MSLCFWVMKTRSSVWVHLRRLLTADIREYVSLALAVLGDKLNTRPGATPRALKSHKDFETFVCSAGWQSESLELEVCDDCDLE